MRLLPLVLALPALFLASSCVRSSTVVRVKKDGAGSIVARYYFSPETIAMIAQLEKLGGDFGGLGGAPGGGPQLGLLRDIANPDEDSLIADSENYGEGVRYATHEADKDDKGWEGYTVVYEFDDIRKVRIDETSMPGNARAFVESTGEDLTAGKGGSLTFELAEGVLTVKSTFAKEGMEGVIDEDQFAQAKEMGMAPSAMIKMGAGMAGGMRVGYFLRIDGEIAETNAEHVSGDLITLSDADLEKVLLDPDLGEFIDKAAADPKAVTPEAFLALIKKLEAMTVETKDSITVKWK